jgi:outer membrane protein assembly factor BamD
MHDGRNTLLARLGLLAALGALLLCTGVLALGQSQGTRTQSDLSPLQRLDIMVSKLEAMRRSLNSAVDAFGPQDKNADKEKSAASLDDPRQRLRGLQKEVASILSEVNDIKGKQDRAEKYDSTALDRLETSVTDVDGRVQAVLQATASDRRVSPAAPATSASSNHKKKGKFFGLFGGGGNDKYEDLTGTVAAGRDRVLFEDAAKEVRKGQYDTGRLLFTTIINTYPDSPFLPLAKLAVADSFYLEGTKSALIQAAQAYLDWLTFFPTDQLADDAMLKVAEAEMRQLGLPDREITPALKAEQRLKALLQQYPQTSLRPQAEERLREVQDNLGMHSLQVAVFYWQRAYTGKGGLKGAQSRLKEIVDKYPNFSYMDEVLFRLATTYQHEEEPDEAAKFYQRLLKEYPTSEFAEKARDQLNIIGAPIPEPDPVAINTPRPERPSFIQNVMQQVSGRAEVTVDRNGILISKDSKAQNDLIDQALQNNGQVPDVRTPVAPVQQTNRPTAPVRGGQSGVTNSGGSAAQTSSQTGPGNPAVVPVSGTKP